MAAISIRHSLFGNGRGYWACRVQQLPDEKLLERYRSGESGALRILIERHHDELLRFLIRLTGDRQSAEDVFQETFLQVHISADTFDSSRRFRPWLFTIAANKGRDLIRKRIRRQEVDLQAPVRGSGGEVGDQTYVDLMELDVPGPGEGLESAETEARVQRAVRTLSPTLREILLLAYFQRLSYASIAEELGIPLGTVKSRLHAAVAAFARAWHRESAPKTAGQDEPTGKR